MTGRIEILNVMATQQLHHLAKAIFRVWRDQQTHMVSRHDIGVNPVIILVAGQLECFKEELTIRICA
jgi:hypothetical protein